jgi:hypothetical protein
MKNNPCGFACWISLSLPFGVGIVEISNGGGSVTPRLILGSEEAGWSRVNLL